MIDDTTARRQQWRTGQAVARARKRGQGLTRMDIQISQETKRRLLAVPPEDREKVILAGLDALTSY